MSKKAHIVALKADTIELDAGLGFGIVEMNEARRARIFGAQAWIGPRPLLEEDPTFVQLIPYIVLKRDDKVIAYVRAKAGGEGRLHNKASIGFGGHVDAADIVVDEHGVIDVEATMRKAAIRELAEEAGISIDETVIARIPAILEWTHVIHSRATPVDAVHLALVVTIDLDLVPGDMIYEDAIADAKAKTLTDLIAADEAEGDARVEMETWTGLVARLQHAA